MGLALFCCQNTDGSLDTAWLIRNHRGTCVQIRAGAAPCGACHARPRCWPLGLPVTRHPLAAAALRPKSAGGRADTSLHRVSRRPGRTGRHGSRTRTFGPRGQTAEVCPAPARKASRGPSCPVYSKGRCTLSAPSPLCFAFTPYPRMSDALARPCRASACGLRSDGRK